MTDDPDKSAAWPLRVLRWFATSWVLLFLITFAIGFGAALWKQAIASSGPNGWNSVMLRQDIVQNGFIAAVLTAAAASIKKYQDRARELRTQSKHVLQQIEIMSLVITGWSWLPPKQAPPAPMKVGYKQSDVDQMVKAAAIWRSSANILQVIQDCSKLDESKTEVERAQDISTAASNIAILLPSLTGSYLGEGARMRRLIWLNHLVNDLAVVETAPREQLAAAARGARTSALQLIGWVQHTNSAIVDDLILDRRAELEEAFPTSAFVHDGILRLLPYVRGIDVVFQAKHSEERDYDYRRALQLLLLQVTRSVGALKK